MTILKTKNTITMAKRHLLKWNALTILSLLIYAYSCTDNEEKSSDNLDRSTPQEIIEAKNFLKDKILSEIDLNKTFDNPANTFFIQETITLQTILSQTGIHFKTIKTKKVTMCKYLN